MRDSPIRSLSYQKLGKICIVIEVASEGAKAKGARIIRIDRWILAIPRLKDGPNLILWAKRPPELPKLMHTVR
jgi:hypothetical protein